MKQDKKQKTEKKDVKPKGKIVVDKNTGQASYIDPNGNKKYEQG